ncbi:MAG TPA: flagellar filament capping protein FliD [Acidobacteriaceae bacterium]|jgi:flagellar hook-associated protein 2|nr:flagellar filament capping protein FliD [Acidobacteriaceae bacterium]
MGSVGISFGSPTSGQGFDVSTTVSAIVANLQAVETPWKNQLTTLQSQDTALTSIGTDLSSLSTALQALTDFNGVFSEKEGSSSDTSVVALTSATSAAVAGSHTIVVGQLAQTYSYASGAVGASDTLTGSLAIGGQTITISDGTATDSSGNTIPQNNTLATLASYINDGDYGVQANVVTGSSGSQLALVSETSGAAGSVTIGTSGSPALTDSTTGEAVAFSQQQKGQDAKFSVDGISTTSSSNTVTDAIPGVTMQLLNAPSDSEPVQVEITDNDSDVESAVSSFVSAYNKVAGDLTTQEGDDSSGDPEPLYGSSTLAMLQEQLQQAVIFTQSSGAITSLSQLGITANSDGTLTLDGSALDSALDSSFQDAMNFFQSSGSSTSFGANLTTTLSNLSNSGPSGEIYLALQQDSSQESTLNTNITNENKNISTEQTQLTTELNEANYTLQEIPTELQSVNELYSAITGYDENPGG